MRKILTMTAMVLICPVFLSGCWDRKEINDIAFVLGSAIDKDNSGYIVSVQIASPRALGGPSGSSGGGKPWYIESKSGKSIREATEPIQASNSRTLDFSNRRSIVIGEKVAKEGISSILDLFTRSQKNRLLNMIAISEGLAYNILDSDTTMEQFPTEVVRELVISYTKEAITLKTVINQLLSEGIDPVIPIIKVDNSVPEKLGKPDKNILIEGLAIFKGDQMVGTLKGELAEALILGKNQRDKVLMNISAPDGKGGLGILIKESYTEIKPVVHEDDVTMHVSITSNGTILENESNFSPISETGIYKIDELVEKKMKDDLAEAIGMLQNKYKADSMGFGHILHDEKAKDWDRLKDRWDDIYPHVKVVIDVNFDLETVGLNLEPIGRSKEEIVHD